MKFSVMKLFCWRCSIADVNIESVFHELTHRKEYVPYDGMLLDRSFQISEHEEGKLDSSWFLRILNMWID